MKLIKELGMLYPNEHSKEKRRYGIYECPVCSSHFRAQTTTVKNGKSTKCIKCGPKKHAMSYDRMYQVFSDIKQRCYNNKHKSYKNYGGRGIVLSDELDTFEKFNEYVSKLDNYKRKGYSIDRINNESGYEKGNLRWATTSTQARNKRATKNTSGYRGVKGYGNNGKFLSRIRVNYKSIHIGVFDYSYTAAYAYDSYIFNNNLEHTRNFA